MSYNQLQWIGTVIVLLLSAMYWISRFHRQDRTDHHDDHPIKTEFQWRSLSLSSSLLSSSLFSSSSSTSSSSSSCPNPNCIRCRRYRQVQGTAIRRLPYIYKDIRMRYPGWTVDRIIDSIRHPAPFADRSTNTKQTPSGLLFVRELLTEANHQPLVTNLYPQVVDIFTNLPATFRDRVLQEVASLSLDEWTKNDTPSSSSEQHQDDSASGCWYIASLLNQGTWNNVVTSKCPLVTQFLQQTILNDYLLDKCLFGNAFVSCLQPGTRIEPHCGPTNIRHRLQYILSVPTNHKDSRRETFTRMPRFQVCNTILPHQDIGSVFVFDDSFEHSVDYDVDYDDDDNDEEEEEEKSSRSPIGTSRRIDVTEHHPTSRKQVVIPTTDTPICSPQCRVVLIVDLWHCQLNVAERALLQDLYPPLSSSSSSLAR